ncbi:MAG: OsmC family protein [Mucilaginibacter sp.]|uniref:OsmC family protein n=1 Tax=Mucilaginibacter sp. TaxID=1882438 RepID=UPI0032637922
MKEHHYLTNITWTGNTGEGTKTPRSYERDHTIQVEGKPAIPGTSEVSMLGNKVRYNPEELLLAALSACHMLVYLYLCSQNKIVVTAYIDKATGTMQDTPDGGGHFTEAILKPEITINGEVERLLLQQLHQDANKQCYIANSCNFPVRHEPVYFFEG